MLQFAFLFPDKANSTGTCMLPRLDTTVMMYLPIRRKAIDLRIPLIVCHLIEKVIRRFFQRSVTFQTLPVLCGSHDNIFRARSVATSGWSSSIGQRPFRR